MRRAVAALALACGVLGACRGGPPAARNGLPAFAGSVRVETALTSAELIDAVHLALADGGFRSQGANWIVTDPVLFGDLRARVTARVDGSTVTASSEYAQAAQEPPAWRRARNAPGAGEGVFLAMEAIFRGLPHERLVYLFEE